MVQAYSPAQSSLKKAHIIYTAGQAHLILLRACSSRLLTVVKFSCRVALSVLYLSLSLVIRSSCSNRRCLVSWSDWTAAFCSCCRSEQHRPVKRPARRRSERLTAMAYRAWHTKQLSLDWNVALHRQLEGLSASPSAMMPSNQVSATGPPRQQKPPTPLAL